MHYTNNKKQPIQSGKGTNEIVPDAFLLELVKPIALPDITNIPSGLKDASKVEVLETGLTLYVDS